MDVRNVWRLSECVGFERGGRMDCFVPCSGERRSWDSNGAFITVHKTQVQVNIKQATLKLIEEKVGE